MCFGVPVTTPAAAANGDNAVICACAGLSTPVGGRDYRL